MNDAVSQCATWKVSPLRGFSFQSYLPLPLCDLFCAYSIFAVSCFCYSSVHDALSTLLVDSVESLCEHRHFDYLAWFIQLVLNKLGHNHMQSGQLVLVFGAHATRFPASVIQCNKKTNTASLYVPSDYQEIALNLKGGYSRASRYDGGIRLDGVPTLLMARATFDVSHEQL